MAGATSQQPGYEQGEERFWQMEISPEDPGFGLFLGGTHGVVDEEAGGIVAYVGSEERAAALVTLLATDAQKEQVFS